MLLLAPFSNVEGSFLYCLSTVWEKGTRTLMQNILSGEAVYVSGVCPETEKLSYALPGSGRLIRNLSAYAFM